MLVELQAYLELTIRHGKFRMAVYVSIYICFQTEQWYLLPDQMQVSELADCRLTDEY